MDAAKIINQATKQFITVVKQALQHLHDPQWLAEESLLATPYMLGGWVTNQDPDTAKLTPAAALQAVLIAAIHSIEQHDNKRAVPWAELLRMRYIERPEQKVYQIVVRLNTSEPAYHRHHNNALSQLADEILILLKPALKLESPKPSSFFVGRDEIIAEGTQILNSKTSLSITGAAGVGKSTYASTLANTLAPEALFWFTFRPSLNDHLNNIIVSLAYFLHKRGISTVWIQIVSDNHQVSESALNLLTHELENRPDNDFILIFDEIDLLQIGEVEAHTQIFSFLRSLCGLVSVIFVGQKLLIETEKIIDLQGIAPSAVRQMFTEQGFILQQEQILSIHRQTQGNPRLLELVLAKVQAASQREDKSVAEVLADLPEDPSVEFLLHRIWHHLDQHEMYLVELLAIFESAAPQAEWTKMEQVNALTTLLQWRLLQMDGNGGITMLPVIKGSIARLIDADEAIPLHLDAARICLKYRQFTTAAYHFNYGGDPALCINLLNAHLEDELDQGQATLAQSIVKSISSNQLSSNKEKETLRYLRAKLHQTLGEQSLALNTLQKGLWRIPFLKVQAKRLEGDITESIGQPQLALQAYHAAYETIENLIGESASIHRARGYLHTYEHNFEQTQTEIWRIRHDAANLEGYMLSQKGDVPAAKSAYEEAIDFAQKAGYAYGVANTNMNLGCLYGWQREVDSAETYLQEAISFFEMTNRVNKLAEATYNLAFAYRLAEQYSAGLEPAETALQLFSQVGRELGQALSSQILAEIHLALNDIDRAEECIHRVVDMELTNTQADGLRCLGEIRLKQGNIAEAKKMLHSALQIAQETQAGIIEAYVFRTLAEAYLASSDELQAQEYIAQAIEIFSNANMDAEVEHSSSIFSESSADILKT